MIEHTPGMTTQPEALRLTDRIERGNYNHDDATCAAAELRRLRAELRCLHAQRQMLLEFARWILSLKTGGMIEGRARAAIKAVEGGK